jgi:hypothetical protein
LLAEIALRIRLKTTTSGKAGKFGEGHLNHASFDLPNNDVSRPSLGTITSATNGARTIQLGAGLYF